MIWAKTNPMPHSVGDRLSATYDVIYFLVRSHNYYFDLDAIRLPHRSRQGRSGKPGPITRPAWAGPLAGTNAGLSRARPAGQPGHPLGKNPGDVWALPTRGFRGAHFATFPRAVVEQQPTTDTYSLAQSQEEFYFSLPYEKFDLCLYGHNQGLPVEVVAAGVGLSVEDVGRVFRDIEQKRRATRYLHLPPFLLEPVPEISGSDVRYDGS